MTEARKIEAAEPVAEIEAGGLGYRDTNDAPCHLNASEASAWASGWNAAIEALEEAKRLASEQQS